MANIATLLNTIKNAVYGKDMRLALHDAIKATNDDVKTKEPKLTAGTSSQYYRGDKTWQDLPTPIRNTSLSGLSTSNNSAITSSDTVLTAFGKLQAQMNTTERSANKGVANGYAGLDSTGKVPVGQLPDIASGTTAQYWRGDKTWQDLMTAVRTTVLTGLSTSTNTAISASNTALQAFGRLQAQITARLPLSGGTMTGAIDMGSNKVTSSATPSTDNDYTNKKYVDVSVDNLKESIELEVETRKKDIGQLSNLKTTEKISIVGSINEVDTKVNEGFEKVDQESAKNIDLINQTIECYHKIKCKSAGKIITDSSLDINSDGNWAQIFNIPDIELQSKYHNSLTLPNLSIEFASIYDAGTNVDCYVKYRINGTEISVGAVTQRHSDIKEEYCKFDLATGSITEVMLCVGNVSMNKTPDYRPDGTVVYVYSGEAIPLNINSSIHIQQSVDLTDIKYDIGQLPLLETTAKGNLVSAINELKSSIGSSSGSEIQIEELKEYVDTAIGNVNEAIERLNTHALLDSTF